MLSHPKEQSQKGHFKMSMYDIVGNDDDLEALLAGDPVAVGALPGSGTMAALARARRVDPNAVVAVPKTLGNRRRKILPGTTSPSVAAGASATITYETQEVFRPERFVVASAIAASFVITSIIVGTKNQLSAPGSVPADIFAATAFDCDLHFDTANIGNKITVTVTSIEASAAKVFYAAFLGTSLS